MDWSDRGIVLAARKHGESSAVVQLLTREHGRHAGLVRGGAGSRARGIYQAGNLVEAAWRARLAEHLGTYRCEVVVAYGAALLDDPLRLAAVTSACALVEVALAEREPHERLFDGTLAFLDSLEGSDWAAGYVAWELALLADLGYGLDLSSCTVTGETAGLAYVSPKSGRAVSRAAGAAYRDRLLPLPAFLGGAGRGEDAADIVAGLRLTGHFLRERVLAALDREMPPARARLVDRIGRLTTISRV